MSLPLLLAAAALLVTGWMLVRARKAPARRAAWGVWSDDRREMVAVARYYRSRHADSATGIDDRTWADLNMDGVFSILDRAESLVGQQLLYARLRSASNPDTRAAFEALVTTFETDAQQRQRARDAVGRMRDVDADDLWWLVQPGSFAAERWHVVFPVAGLAMLVALLLIPVYPAMLFAVAAGSIVGLLLRVTAGKHLRVSAHAFRQVRPLLSAASALRPLCTSDTKELTSVLHADVPSLLPLRRTAGWVGRDTAPAAAGDLGAMVIEYLNLLLFLDGNAVYFGSRQLQRHGDALLRVVEGVGAVDAALSIASYRTGTRGWVRPTFVVPGAEVVLAGLRHPLLPDAVPNSLRVVPPAGMIITGSNMSGKTTFLRTVGVATVLAQTINTCLCDVYTAPLLVVRSCIGRADEPEHGKSYYLVEVDAVLDLLRASRMRTPHLMLFDELFRGTNTIERVAAGEAVLVSLIQPDADGRAASHLVIAATHDQELVSMLDGKYAPAHFADEIGPSGVAFDYRLRSGPSSTRNAIALLAHRGAPTELVARATSRAEALDVAYRHAASSLA
jgi:hypothetical protein